ncbi:MAG: ribonuclease Y [bacterium]
MDGISLVLLILLLAFVIASVVMGFLAFNNSKLVKELKVKLASKEYKEISEEEAIEKASVKAKEILLKAKTEVLEVKTQAEEKIKLEVKDLDEREKRLDVREQGIIQRSSSLDERFDKLEAREKSLEQAKKDVKVIRDSLEGRIAEIAQLTKEQAEEELKSEISEGLTNWRAKKIKESEAELTRDAEEKTQGILVDAMARGATDYFADTTLTSFEIENEELKGKIIGKEGRNIKALERMTGVDVVVDEAPNLISISCFDPIRREVAAITLKKLLKDGRIHPGTIEETVMKVKEDMAREIRKNGEDLAYRAGFPDLPEEIIKLLGRFKYRFSYGQNLAKHVIEMVQMGEAIAKDLNADVKSVKLACLLHDIGKVMLNADNDKKPHHHLSGEIARKYKFDPRVINAIEAHHGDIASTCIEAEIIKIVDSISGSRPGARRENYEEYVKRIRALEEIANSYKGVKETFAVHAGREVRVIVKPEELTDDQTTILAHDIAKEIEETQQYPGIITVIVIREMRVKEQAK